MSENVAMSEKFKKPIYFYVSVAAVAVAFSAFAILTVLSFIKVAPTAEEIRNQPGYSTAVKCVERLKGNHGVITLYAIEQTTTTSGSYYMVKYADISSAQKHAYFRYYKGQLTSITEEVYNHSIQSYISNSTSEDIYFGKNPQTPKTRIPFSADALALIAEDTGVNYGA